MGARSVPATRREHSERPRSAKEHALVSSLIVDVWNNENALTLLTNVRLLMCHLLPQRLRAEHLSPARDMTLARTELWPMVAKCFFCSSGRALETRTAAATQIRSVKLDRADVTNQAYRCRRSAEDQNQRPT